MNWREHLLSFASDVKLRPGASPAAIAAAQSALDIRFPESLSELLLQSNGVYGRYAQFIWPVEEIAPQNKTFRSGFVDDFMPFDHLLFFGDGGNGDQFAFAIHRKGISDEQVFAWNHEDDSRYWVAQRLATFAEWWLTGKIIV
jgi:hypothetical protein